MRILNSLLILFLAIPLNAHWVRGHVQNSSGSPLEGVHIAVESEQKGCSSNAEGYFEIELTESAQVLVVSHLGYRTERIHLSAVSEHLDVVLFEDRLGLEEVVVSGNRQAIKAHQNPVILARIEPELFKQVSALSLAEGLNFSPGLRVENNCQNCGFTQVRMNGLDGAYSQILLNSRPVFSSLMAVYGLEMIPSGLIERVEVVRGGGSSLYGGNAIGGTINIITKEPHENQLEWNSTLQNIDASAWEHSHSIGLSLAGPNQKTGSQAFAFSRNREAWDANADGYTEITQLQNRTFGLSSFWKPKSRSKLSLDLFSISEFRRGGSDLHLLPHQSSIAEQLEHSIFSGGIAWESLSADSKSFYSLYSSLVSVNRNSYYGAGGRVIVAGDSIMASDLLALNAYGETEDLSWISGLQYHRILNDVLEISLGTEYQQSRVKDQMPGYHRLIDQSLKNWATYSQLEWKPTKKFVLQGGTRLDINYLSGNYQLLNTRNQQDADFINFSPRLNLKYIPIKNWQIRASYAKGFRTPQAFNEDLHIETVGGAALFIQMVEDLKAEESHSINLSSEHLIIKDYSEHQFILTAFLSQLLHPFVLLDRQALENGTAVQWKSNGDPALVSGLSLEYQAAWANGLKWQSSITSQNNRFQKPQVLWTNPSDEDDYLRSSEFLRSPNWYGYLQGSYTFKKPWEIAAALNYTGSMLVSRLIDSETEQIELLRSPQFFDAQASLQYKLKMNNKWQWEYKLGVKNIFNAYQKDLSVGANRDASYIYGPILPRTFYLSIRLAFQA